MVGRGRGGRFEEELWGDAGWWNQGFPHGKFPPQQFHPPYGFYLPQPHPPPPLFNHMGPGPGGQFPLPHHHQFQNQSFPQ
jgi:hypothetical protein